MCGRSVQVSQLLTCNTVWYWFTNLTLHLLPLHVGSDETQTSRCGCCWNLPQLLWSRGILAGPLWVSLRWTQCAGTWPVPVPSFHVGPWHVRSNLRQRHVFVHGWVSEVVER